MKNSALKRIIAVVLCLVVFAGSELTGVTNIVGDLFASENSEIEMDAADPVEETEEIVLSEEEPEPEENQENAEGIQETEENPGTSEETEDEGNDSADVSAAEEGSGDESLGAEESNEDSGAAAEEEGGEESSGGETNNEDEELSGNEMNSNGEETSGSENENRQENSDGEADIDNEEPADDEENAGNIETPEDDAAVDGENVTADGAMEEEQTEETEEESFPEFADQYTDDKVEIHVSAEEGVLPEGAVLSVIPIVKQDVEELEAQEEIDSEKIEKIKDINTKYDETLERLEASIPDDDVRKIAGFVAYDIAFFAPVREGELEEIKPEGQVAISMEFKEPYLPAEVSDNENIEISSVNLIHMNETEEGLEAEILSDALIKSTEDAEVENVEFASDMFSVYAVSWIRDGLMLEYEDADVRILVEEQEKGSIPEDATLDVVSVTEENEKTREQYSEIETKLQENITENAKQVVGFFAYNLNLTDEEHNIVEPQGNVKVRMEYKEAAAPEGIGAEMSDVSVGMLNLNQNSATDPGTIQITDAEKIETEEQKLQSAELETDSFEPVLLAAWRSQAAAVIIKDDIAESGCLRVDMGADSISGQSLHYVWYKCVDTAEPVRVEGERFGKEFSIAADGSWLNVLLTGGALHKGGDGKTAQEKVSYYVEAYSGENKVATSERYQIRYWDELQNGSFETPVVVPKSQGQCFVQLPIETEGVIWSTTGEDQLIELIRPDLTFQGMQEAYHWVTNCYGENNVRIEDEPKGTDGFQFAELNAEAAGALYQDVLTMPDETLNYWLSHRARSVTSGNHANRWSQEYMQKDYMYVVIAPTKLVENVKTQEELLAFIEKYEGTDGKDGVFVQEYEGNNWAWTDHAGTYTPVSYLTRFFFVAGDTASTSKTVGNFLDNVGFSQKLPPAAEGKFDLEIVKTIRGLKLEDVNQDGNLSEEEIKQGIAGKLANLTFSISAKYPAGFNLPSENLPCIGELKITDPGWKWTVNADGSYTGSIKYEDQAMDDMFFIGLQFGYIYTIEEKNADYNSCEPKAELNILGGSETEGDHSVLIKERDAVSFHFTNTYEPETPENVTLKITKVWEDNSNESYVRPSQIKVLLQSRMAGDTEWKDCKKEGMTDGVYEWNEPDSSVLEDPDRWVLTLEDIPFADEYRIIEVEVDEYYTSSATLETPVEFVDGMATITNTLKTYSYEWQIIKAGTTSDTPKLEGAEFTLTSAALPEENAKVYYGISQKASGEIKWFNSREDAEAGKDSVNILAIAPGEYELEETKAPTGYALSSTSWRISLGYENIQINDGKTEPTDASKKTQDGKIIYEYTFLNEAVYELPSTGGIGIHWYMVSGTLLMMAGILILYKRKYAGRC